MGLGITSRMLRDFPAEIATARNDLRYSRTMVQQHHILLPRQPLLDRVWFVRPHVRALAASEDAMTFHRGPPTHKQPPPGHRRTPPSSPRGSVGQDLPQRGGGGERNVPGRETSGASGSGSNSRSCGDQQIECHLVVPEPRSDENKLTGSSGTLQLAPKNPVHQL